MVEMMLMIRKKSCDDHDGNDVDDNNEDEIGDDIHDNNNN
jgi:hypothetical protein